MKVLIVDDEQPARERLRQLLDDMPGYDVAGDAGNGREAVDLAARLQPDIVLLDIRMPGMDGIEAAQHMNALDAPPAIVFTTAYDEYAIDAFEVRAIGYVLKPVRRSRLEGALEQAARLAASTLAEVAAESGIESRRQHICAKVQDELLLVPIADISYFQADQKYVCVHHDNGEHLIDDSLKSLEKEFGDSFVRIHRGALVAVNRIDRLDRTGDGKTRIVLRDGSHDDAKQLIISRRHVAEVKKRLRAS
jgi:two-component system response regulator AlgR